jgi:aldose sugar dehydrogenase
MRAPALVLALSLASAGHVACSPSSNPDSPPDSGTPSPGGEIFTTQDGARFRVETVAGSLQIPWSMVFAPDGRLFVTERPGRVRIFAQNAATSEVAIALDDVSAQGEAGLLGIALDPEFTTNRYVYLYYTAQVGGGGAVNRVVRYREVTNRLAERVVLLDNIPANAIHDGGRLRFGPDGLLYVTTGDAATTSRAQDIASTAGKILRITRDGATPRDNPFSSPVYSIGHRNPQGLDWHPVTGDLWASEHGNSGNDEVNVIDAGADYGWPRIEGSQAMPGMRTPIRFYSPSIAPSGASFYRGSRFPAFANNLFVATLRGTHILRLRIDAGSPRSVAAEERLLNDRYGRIRDVIVGPDGLLYFCTSNRDGRGNPAATDDRVARLVPAS